MHILCICHAFLTENRDYLIPDAVRGTSYRYWAIRYSWNIMPVWNYVYDRQWEMIDNGEWHIMGMTDNGDDRQWDMTQWGSNNIMDKNNLDSF